MNLQVKHISKSVRLALITGAALTTTLVPNIASAAVETKADEDVELIAIVGSRAAPRSVAESPVPIDIIGGDEFENQGNTDMDNLLSAVVPSYNVNAQPISDAATLVRPANLRGLPPDSTLVLVNGKRRHRAAVISFLGGGISDGSQGPDVSVIPGIALKQVEVLRDGAAAQYGSDAIAGVLNFVLKDDADGGAFEMRWGEYYEGDGDTIQYSGNLGLPLTNNGFLNMSFEYKEADATSRSIQRGDAIALRQRWNDQVATPAQIWGSPELKEDFKFFFNGGVELSADSELYFFGNSAYREAEGGFFFRNPDTRPGVFGNGDYRLVGDLTGDMSGNCSSTIDPTDYWALQDVMADPNCFVFNEMFFGGFTPRFGGTIKDSSFVVGYKGEWGNGIMFDLSASWGKNDADFMIKNTVNASMGPDTPTEFNPGRYVQEEKGVNFDMSREVAMDGLENPMNLAFGMEWREDTFEIYAGDTASWTIGPLASQGFGIGSNGFPGFKPSDAGSFSRSNWAAYVDAEADINEKLMMGFALRYEDFEDFGTTTNGKVNFRYEVNDEMALRGSVSTGFRAPTVGQANVRNVTTAFENGVLQDQATLPPTNPISVRKGGKLLQPEESMSFTFGTVLNTNDWNITVDYFNIEVTDRISQTSTLALSQADIDALVAQGIQDATSYTSVKFFTNDFDTTTQGIDFVANKSLDLWDGDTDLQIAFNWTDTKVDSFNPSIVSATKVRQLEENLPSTRGSVTLNHEIEDWRVQLRGNYFGSFYEAHLDDGTLPIEGGSKFTVDMEVGYRWSENLDLVFGAQNMFDTYPDDNPWADIVGASYPVTSPMGFNGGFYYWRARYSF